MMDLQSAIDNVVAELQENGGEPNHLYLHPSHLEPGIFYRLPPGMILHADKRCSKSMLYVSPHELERFRGAGEGGE